MAEEVIHATAEEPAHVPYRIDPEATGLIQTYTANPSYYRLNAYAANSPYVPDPDPDASKPKFLRYCFPFDIRSDGHIPESSVVAEHAAVGAGGAMVMRTINGYKLLIDPDRWLHNPVKASGSGLTAVVYALREMRHRVESTTGRECANGNIRLIMSPTRARELARHSEYKVEAYDRGWEITDQSNPNRKYGLAPDFKGARIVVENSIVLVGKERKYVWGPDLAVVLYQDPDPEFSTIKYTLLENMTVETRYGPDGRQGRIVDDYETKLQRPEFLFPIQW